MDLLNILIVTLDPLSGTSWLFKFGWSYLISRASEDNKSKYELHVLTISKQL